ncbi:hypothetical protein KC19_3G126600 [Ceratodon purpureus]|uniref:Uncharacterized protein n=1 Tax=Ceratodon purpureus TaxID=3225 RepID=A0A8T0IL88_CERPU|nr:hypothetical protein KC19_3G126600 [Ceratodon purpureus]
MTDAYESLIGCRVVFVAFEAEISDHQCTDQ